MRASRSHQSKPPLLVSKRKRGEKKEEDDMALKIGDKAPDFKLLGVDNKTYTLDSFKDKKIVTVMFICVHCPYVRAWEPRFLQIQKDYADKGVTLVGITSNDPVKFPEDSFENTAKWAKEKGYNFPYLYDEDQSVARAYGAERTPEVFVFDEKRILRYHGRIDDNHEDPTQVKTHYLRDALDALLAGKPVPIAETQPVGCTIKWK
jgi:peroxiredoxin